MCFLTEQYYPSHYEKTHPHSILKVPTTQLAKMSIDPKFVEPYLTLPYRTLPYLTLPYLTLPYLTVPYLTYLITPHRTAPPFHARFFVSKRTLGHTFSAFTTCAGGHYNLDLSRELDREAAMRLSEWSHFDQMCLRCVVSTSVLRRCCRNQYSLSLIYLFIYLFIFSSDNSVFATYQM